VVQLVLLSARNLYKKIRLFRITCGVYFRFGEKLMISAQEHLVDEQIVCWNCEETVHESAVQCPYCYVDMARHPVERDSKIAPFHHTHTSEEISAKEGTLSFLFSLLFLLSGSALFFLSVLVAFFARGGEFTLRWSEQNWSAFLGLGIAFLSFGTIFLQNVPGGRKEL